MLFYSQCYSDTALTGLKSALALLLSALFPVLQLVPHCVVFTLVKRRKVMINPGPRRLRHVIISIVKDLKPLEPFPPSPPNSPFQ